MGYDKEYLEKTAIKYNFAKTYKSGKQIFYVYS
jgi:hypothetical protein